MDPVYSEFGVVVAMVGWLLGIVVTVVVLGASWLALALVARFLPPGLAKEIARFVPCCVLAALRLRRDPRVPRRAKYVLTFAGLYTLSGINVIPDFVPVIGLLDNVIVLVVALRYVSRRVARDVLFAAWSGHPAVLSRLIGGPRVQRDPSGPRWRRRRIRDR
ncbi:YkvA family protein [Kutzneria sp. 744]|uniref:YkvA family protein n=1 Tax=Kutzneria sp. (strain 744) TaxID=345341 RepID=UPI0003EEAA10|nr:DUF1232 domain-containing protein [Kutzneria sp. 744]EWM13705.1 hypothetical protein KUTG_04009 [Kutzneria sp. 744]HTI24930.1 DUF1232 domain-containing protein [Kutzneria sp.]